jgi:hypothetical protein
MSAVEGRVVDGESLSPSSEIIAKLSSILSELDFHGESIAAIHVNSAIEALQAGQSS